MFSIGHLISGTYKNWWKHMMQTEFKRQNISPLATLSWKQKEQNTFFLTKYIPQTQAKNMFGRSQERDWCESTCSANFCIRRILNILGG